MGMRSFAATLLCGVLLGLAPTTQAQTGPSIETLDWPDSGICHDCMRLQFDRLELRLPPASIRRVLFSGVPALHLFIDSDDIHDSVTLVVPHPPDIVAFYREAGLLNGLEVSSPKALFEVMGKSIPASTNLERLRKAYGIDLADRYLMAEKEQLTAFLIESAYQTETLIYLIVEGEPGAYLLAGKFDRARIEMLLSHMSVAAPP